MGGKDSKQAFLTYDDAVKRVSDAELQRLKDAFKRYSTFSGLMNANVFIIEVLGNGVPIKLADRLFRAFGGLSKGISFKDLLCGLVLLTRGGQEERIKFLFGLFANESLTFVQKEDMDALVLEFEGQVPHTLSDLFRESDQVNFEWFRKWMLINCESLSIAKWLLKEPASVSLSNDHEMPTFYQTLAGVTHLEEADIIELEKRYWQFKSQTKTGRFDIETFRPMVSPPLPEKLVAGLFNAFDENRDDHVDFKEMACGISACCRGPMLERQKFCFKIFDADQDGLLSRQELETMVAAMMVIRKESVSSHQKGSDGLDDITPEGMASSILEKHDGDGDGHITQEEYLTWTVTHKLPEYFLSLLFQICHVVLGLKPQTKEEEGQVIMSWLDREDRYGLQVAQVWYLVTMAWWRQWLQYTDLDTCGVQASGDNQHLDIIHAQPKRGSSLCPNLTRKTSIGQDETISLVSTPNYSTLPTKSRSSSSVPSQGSQTSNYATLPRSSPSRHNGTTHRTPSEVQLGSRQVLYNASPASSVNSTPQPSPCTPRRALGAQKPGAIDNTPLLVTNGNKLSSLTNEGGRLRRDRTLCRGRDFELLPMPVWKSLFSWYGGSTALPRTVIMPRQGHAPELELYPLCIKLMRHQQIPQRAPVATSFGGMMGGISGMVTSTMGMGPQPSIPKRYVAHMACFSRKHTLKQVYDFLSERLTFKREDIRLWKFQDEQNMTLLEDEEMTMEQLRIDENSHILIEVRNKDLTWPEEMSLLANNKTLASRQQLPSERGATGLSNLGNTCFMNSAVQCVSNTQILTLYFTGGMHLYELNRMNPLGMKGHVAQRYGELVKDLWSATAKSIAPLKLRWTIGKYAPRFNGFQQHDSQEFLAFLLDGLHEDLNRVHNKPYVELKDSDGRLDEIVAKEAWENHLLRNRSIVVDLFHGLLKSCVRCKKCNSTSVRFDPFTFLSLPLPMDSCNHVEVIVMPLSGATPTKYGLRLGMEEKYRVLKQQLSELAEIPCCQLLLVEVSSVQVKSFPQDSQKIKLLEGNLFAYELPPTPPIPTLTAEEERGIQGKDSPSRQGGLSQIQRMHTRHNTPTKQSLPPINSPSEHLDNNNTTQKFCESSAANDAMSNHHRNTSVVSNLSNSSSPQEEILTGFVVALHRKMNRKDVYFLSSQKTRPSLFGIPLILPCDELSTHQDLYQHVWLQVSRLVSPLPPSEGNASNHAQDCDDSLGYEYPFTLRVVQKDGCTCAWCPWYRFCRGCQLECNQDLYNFGSSYIAVDWEATALHLRYQSAQETRFEDHPSVEESRRLQTEPIDLDTCLKAFTKEEELGEDELYFCSKCKEHQPASKKLQIWKLPPILIIHLKRFQFHNGCWVKSRKIVEFPRKTFDISRYVVERSGQKQQTNTQTDSDQTEPAENGRASNPHRRMNGNVVHEIDNRCCGDGPQVAQEAREDDVISHDSVELEDLEDYSNAEYNLYALSSHSGNLGAGHYVTYAKHHNHKWYLYNDSSCKEIPETEVDKNNAYILFYERAGLDCSKFMPDVRGKDPDTAEIDDEIESDFKKMCLIQ